MDSSDGDQSDDNTRELDFPPEKPKSSTHIYVDNVIKEWTESVNKAKDRISMEYLIDFMKCTGVPTTRTTLRRLNLTQSDSKLAKRANGTDFGKWNKTERSKTPELKGLLDENEFDEFHTIIICTLIVYDMQSMAMYLIRKWIKENG